MGKPKKELKLAFDVSVGDEIKIGGLLCKVVKAELVFHHTPDARTRLTLKIVGSTRTIDDMVLFIHRNTPITIQK